MKRIRRFKNDPLQIIGSILTVVGLWFIAYPLFMGHLTQTEVNFSFLGLLNGTQALIFWIAVIVVGLIFVLVTKPLVRKQRRLEDTQKDN